MVGAALGYHSLHHTQPSVHQAEVFAQSHLVRFIFSLATPRHFSALRIPPSPRRAIVSGNRPSVGMAGIGVSGAHRETPQIARG